MLRRILLVLTLALAAALTGAGTASAASPSVTIAGADLLAKGAAVQVNLSVTCDDTNGDPSYPDVYFDVTVRQVVKKVVVEGTSYSQVPCDGSTKTIPVTVKAYSSAFGKKLALVEVRMTEVWTFTTTTTSQEVRLK